MTEDRQNAPCPVDHCGATVGGPCISRDGQIMSRVHPERGKPVDKDENLVARPRGLHETTSKFTRYVEHGERPWRGTVPLVGPPTSIRTEHPDEDLDRYDDTDETPPSEEEKAASRRIFERAFYKVHGRWPDESDMRHFNKPD